MNLNNLFGSNRYFGVDIGFSSVKLAEFKKVGDSIRLVNAKLIELNVDPTSLEAGKKDFLIKQVIDKLFSEVGATTGSVAISISGQAVFIRFVRLPKVAKRKVEQIVRYEAQLQVPFPINEVIWDYQIFDQPGIPEMEVTLVAVKKDIIEASLINFKNSKYDIEFIDVIPFVVYNLANYVDNYEGKIILDIGAKITNIIIVDKTKVWTRSILIAGDEITKAIANALEMNFPEAEALKKKEGIIIIDEIDKSFSDNAEEISGAVTPVLIDILTDITKTIGYYKSQFGDTKVFNEILLTGGSSQLRNIDKFFKNNLDIKVSKLNILDRFKKNIDCNVGDSFNERFVVAVGLGLRHLAKTSVNINLLPKDMIRSLALYKMRWFILGVFSMIILILATINFFVLGQLGIKKEILSDAESTISLHSNYNKQMKRLQDEISKISNKLSIMQELSLEKSYWLDMLLEISKFTSKNIWLTHLEKKDNIIILDGKTTGNFSVITDFKNQLMKSPYFKGIEITKANMEKDATDKDLKVFTLKIEINSSLNAVEPKEALNQ